MTGSGSGDAPAAGLIAPVEIRGRRAPSRVLFGPHETNLGYRREISDRHVAYYARRAEGGAGVIVTEIASVHGSDHPYERAPLAADCGPGWAAVALACRPYGALVLAGLGHAGGQGTAGYSRQPLWGPSRVPDVGTREVPMVMGRTEIDALVAGFAAAARAAAGAGLDGVEIGAGQHSLLRQFCSGLTNHRTDAYGADRALLLRETLAAVRAALGPGPVLGLRLCVDELAPWAGITQADGAELVRSVSGDVDYLVPVRGSALAVPATRPDMHTPPGFNRQACAGIRASSGRSTLIVLQGSVVDPDMAATAVADGTADLVEMTRAQIADPDLVRLVRDGTPERVRPCTLSHQHSSVRDPRNPIVGDEAEPRSGHETTEPPVEGRDPVPRDVLVVGGGPAGLEAARTLALRGHRVDLHERADRIGGALHPAAALPGRSRWSLLIDWWAAELTRLGVRVHTGSDVDDAALAAAEAAGTAVLLATGSRPPAAAPPGVGPVVPVAEFVRAVLRSGSVHGALAEAGVGASAPSVLVSDPVGDATGVGVAELLAASGVSCALVTPDAVAADQLGRTGGLADANGRLDRAGVERIRFGTVETARDGRAMLADVHTGAVRAVRCDLVVDCSARLPQDAPGGPGRMRAGDCVAPRTVAEAVREGRSAALALGARRRPDPPPTARRPDRPSRNGDPHRPSVTLDRPGGAREEPAVSSRSGSGLLHSPLRVGPLVLRNRIVFTAHLTGYAVDGLPTDRHAAYYAARAAGGAGLVITEEHSVHLSDRPYEKLIRGHDPAVLPGYRAITAAVHAYGVPVLAQLNHNGGQSSGMYSQEPVRGPSALPDPMFREVAVAMTERDIAEVVAAYARTAAHCVAGGFDGVELQCSHASLLRMFLSPATNRRTDRYGGPLPNRARIVCEIVEAVREVLGPDRVLGVRIGADERIPGGIGLDDGVALARLLTATGRVDHLNTSIGVATASLYLIEASMHTPPGYAAFIPSAIRHAVSVPVIGVGRFTEPAQADAALAAGECDLVGVARGQIADPEFAAKAADGRPVRRCVGCNQDCVGRVGLNRSLGCVVNPLAGRESAQRPRFPTDRRAPAATGLQVAVVGAGPAGLAAAAAAAERGQRVTLYERDRVTGGQVALAAVAPGRGELGHVVADLLARCERAGVTVRTGVDAHPDLLRSADAIVLATGSAPEPPPWAVPGVLSVHDVLAGRACPAGRVLVVDETGFHQATSTAELLAARGADVEIVTPALVVGQDLGLTLDRENFRRRAHSAGIATGTDLVVTGVTGEPGRLEVALLHHPTGAVEQRRVDAVVHALSTAPCDHLWTTLGKEPVPVHRVGDCLAPRRIDAAIREGAAAGSRIGEIALT